MLTIPRNWVQYKALLIKKNPAHQSADFGSSVTCWFDEGNTHYECILQVPSAEHDEFAADYEAHSNWAVGSRQYPFATGDFEFQGDGIIGTAGLTDLTKNFDYKAPKDLYVSGGMAIIKGSAFGDYIKAQVVDRDGAIPEPYRVAYPNYPVIKQWVNTWYMPDPPAGSSSNPVMIQTPYAGIIPKDLVMRVILHKAAGYSVDMAMNYFLHEAI